MTDTIVGWTLAALAVLWLLYGILVVGGGYHGRLPWDRRERCTCRHGLPPRHMGYRPVPPCPVHPRTRSTPPRPPSGPGGGSHSDVR